MKYTLKAYSIKEQGPRPKQEDSMFPEHETLKDNDRLFLVCDGMGGHSAGEVASGTVCQALSSYILDKCPDAEGKFDDEMFKSALNHAFDILDTKDNGAAKKMGTTMTFLKLHDEGATIAHIGDSRVYHIRPGKDAADTEILFQTYDHSLVNDLVKIGELTPEEAKHSNQKNIITRAMQPNMERRPRADIYHTHDIKPGDYFMLCSDGILEQMEDENIKYIFSPRVKSPEDKVKMIIDVTAQNHDNHTAILVHITDVIDPIPVCPPVPVAETEPNIEKPADNIDNTANIMPEEEEKEDNKISNIVYIVMTIVVLAGAIAYALIPGESNDKPKIAKTEDNRKKTKQVVSQPVNEALSPVEKDGLWGFEDNTGKIVIPCEYDSAEIPDMHGKIINDRVYAVIRGGKWEIINKEKQIKTKRGYDEPFIFYDGFSVVKHDGKFGFIDTNGIEITPCEYDTMDVFSEGFMLAGREADGKMMHGFINAEGKETISFIYEDARRFSEGFAPVKQNGKWTYINTNGAPIVEPKYDNAWEFTEGLAQVQLNGKWGFIDKSGKEVIPCKYDEVQEFSEGLAAVRLNGKWGFIDKAGNEVIPCKYEEIKSSFSNGKAEVMENGKLKSIDKTGNEIIEEEENSQTPEIENMQEQEIAVQPDTNSVEKRIENGKDQQNEPVEPDSSDATTQVEDTNGSSQDTGNKTNQEENKGNAQAKSHFKES